jgi:hypothetical protein
MLVEDPVFSGDKGKEILLYPVSRNQHPVSRGNLLKSRGFTKT